MSKNSPIHLSFRGNIGELWKPKLPDGSELPSKNNETSEPNVPRISFALTVLVSSTEQIEMALKRIFSMTNRCRLEWCTRSILILSLCHRRVQSVLGLSVKE